MPTVPEQRVPSPRRNVAGCTLKVVRCCARHPAAVVIEISGSDGTEYAAMIQAPDCLRLSGMLRDASAEADRLNALSPPAPEANTANPNPATAH